MMLQIDAVHRASPPCNPLSPCIILLLIFQNARLRVSQETDKKMPKNMYFRALV